MGFLSDLFDPGKDTRNSAERAARDAALRNFSVSGPGATARYDVGTGNLNLGLDGQTLALQNALFGQASQQQGYGQENMDLLRQLGMQAIGGMQGISGGGQFNPGMLGITAPGYAQLPQFQSFGGPTAIGGQFAQLPQFQSVNPFTSGPFSPNRGMARSINQAAMGLLPGASQDIAGAEQAALARLRAQAAPQERQAMSDLNERLYGTGQGAVTGNAQVELGGGRLAQAFGRGLGQADLDRQVQAQSLALQRRAGDQAAFSGLLGESRGTQGLDESLRQGLFGRQLGQGQFNLAQQGQNFGQSLQGAQFNEQQLQGLFGRQLGAAQFGAGENQRGFEQALSGANLQQQLAQQLFGQQLQAGQYYQGANQQNFDQLLQQQGFNNNMLANIFGVGQGIAQGQTNLQSGNIQNQLALLGAGLGLNQLPQNLFSLGLQAETSRSNSRLGGSQSLAQIAQATPNPFLDLAVGAMGMAGQFGGASDRRLKEEIRQVAHDDATGLPIYAWKWNQEARKAGLATRPPIGLIAQEVEEKYPEAVYTNKGYLHINYRKLVELTGV